MCSVVSRQTLVGKSLMFQGNFDGTAHQARGQSTTTASETVLRAGSCFWLRLGWAGAIHQSQ